MKTKWLHLLLVMVLTAAGPVFAHEGMDHDEMTEKKGSKMEEEAQKPVYIGNKICPVSGEDVGEMGDIVEFEYEGKIYNLCCAMCLMDFKKDPEKYIKMIEEELVSEAPDEGHDH